MPLIGQDPGLVQARPSFDPPCGSHQLPVIVKYFELIFGTQLSQFLLVGTLPAGILVLYKITQKLCVLPCGVIEHVRCMCSRIVRGNCFHPQSHGVWYMSCDVTKYSSCFSDSVTSPILCKKHYCDHVSFGITSAVFKLQECVCEG